MLDSTGLLGSTCSLIGCSPQVPSYQLKLQPPAKPATNQPVHPSVTGYWTILYSLILKPHTDWQSHPLYISLQSRNLVFSPLLWSKTATPQLMGASTFWVTPLDYLHHSALPWGSPKACSALLHCLLVTLQTCAAICPASWSPVNMVFHDLVESVPAQVHTVIKEKGRQTTHVYKRYSESHGYVSYVYIFHLKCWTDIIICIEKKCNTQNRSWLVVSDFWTPLYIVMFVVPTCCIITWKFKM